MRINKENYFNNLVGYKISDSHFELGSNLHINDYFYAKRLFYNSFYTNRFAFLICRFIIRNFNDLIIETSKKTLQDDLQAGTITLMGYESYAELLISNVRKMLNDYYKPTKDKRELFNHDIYTKNSVFMKNPSKIGNNIISIFPISTTLSSSVRMQNELREMLFNTGLNKNVVFHNPVINCLIISNGDLYEDKIFLPNSLESEFGWQKMQKDKRLIDMVSLDNEGISLQQHYFINMPSVWQKVNECTSCFPLPKGEERCLIETKSNPVTPSLIFNYPKTVNYTDKYNSFQLFGGNDSTVYRKHFIKLSNHFIYYIRTGTFLKKNKPEITKWLKELKTTLTDVSDKSIVIVTPTNGANSGFANLVNDIVFSDTATIIQYNPNDDYLHNFKIFYSGILEYADSIIFIDDVLFSTRTFHEINYYIKTISRKNGQQGINACITLINRCGYHNQIKLEEEFGSNTGQEPLHTFVNISVAPILHKKMYPFEKLKEKFKILSHKSVLDEMRLHFKAKESAFKAIDLVNEFQDLSEYGTPKDFFQFLVLNEFNQLFKYDDKQDRYVEDALLKQSFEDRSINSYVVIEEKIAGSLALQSFLSTYPEYRFEIKNAIFKICTSEPFIQFKNIKEAAFVWIHNDLQEVVSQLRFAEEVADDFFTALHNMLPSAYSKYQEFKFLLKRATKLKMNFIYAKETLRVLEKVLRGIKRHKQIKFYTYQTTEENLDANLSLFDQKADSVTRPLATVPFGSKDIFTTGFITYYIGLLQELIVDHESKALQTVINVKLLIDEQQAIFRSNLKNSYNNDYMNLLRMLVLENTFIFHSSSEKFISSLKSRINLNDLAEHSNCTEFFDDLDKYSRKYSFGYTKKMLSSFAVSKQGQISFNDDISIRQSFVNMIILKAAIQNDKLQNGTVPLDIQSKVRLILQYCCSILDVKEGGAFFAVKYKNKHIEETKETDIAIVGDYCLSDGKTLSTSGIGRDSILYHVFNGVKESHSTKALSCFEVSLDTDNNFQFITNDRIERKDLHEFCETENKTFKNILYIRITEIVDKPGERSQAVPIAVLCFYDNKDIPKDYEFIRFDPKRVRQLLLLRNDINSFISDQLDNDSLRAFIEEQNQIIINKAITHSFDTYIKQYTETLSEIENEDLRDKFDILGTLILNKHLLLKFIAEFLKTKSKERTVEKLSIRTLNMNVSDFKKLIDVYRKVIFSMDLSEIDVIEEKSATVLVSIPSNYIIRWYDFFYKELLFELFYNIRKTYADYINEDDNFQIDFRVSTIDEQTYLLVTNNLYTDLPSSLEPLRRIERVMHSMKEKKGLSLINTISEILYDKKCKIKQFEDKFQLQIPIEIYEEKNTNT